MVIGAVYGPNEDNGCKIFFELLRQNLNRWRGIPIILGGDWNPTYSNMAVRDNPDVLFMQSIPSRIRSDLLLDLCGDLDLSDPFRILNPEVREFSYIPSGVIRKNRSRIDFF